MKDLIARVIQVSEQNPDGFTLHLETMSQPTEGYAIAYQATQNSFGFESLAAVIHHAQRHDGYIGGWLNHSDGLYYFDSVKVISDKREALVFALENEQYAYYDLKHKVEISLIG